MIQKLEKVFFYGTILFLPTQLGKHFWPAFSFVEGIRIDYLSPTLYLTDILVLWLLAMWLLRTLFSIQKTQKTRQTSKSETLMSQIIRRPGILSVLSFPKVLILLALLSITIGISLSLSPIAGLYKLLKIIEMGFFGFYIAVNVSPKRDISTLCILFSIGILFESLLAAGQFLLQSSIGNIFWFFGERTFSGQTPGIANASINGQLLLRPYGTFPHPNVLAGYLVIGMTVIFSNFKKNFFAIAIIIGSIALLLTLSRVVIISWFIVLSSWFMVRSFNKKSLIINPSSLIIFIAVFLAVIFLTPLSSRFTSILDADRETITRRQELNVAAIDMVKKSPVFGVGLNNFLVNLPAYQKPMGGPLWLQPAHNIFLLIAAETGIVGLLFFLGFVTKTILKVTNPKFLITNYQLLIIFLFIFLGMFDHYFLTIQQGQLLLAVVFGLAWADENRRKQT